MSGRATRSFRMVRAFVMCYAAAVRLAATDAGSGGRISGTVADETGRRVPHATVVASCEDRSLSRQTDLAGEFLFPDLSAGACSVRVQKTLFREILQNVVLARGEQIRLTLTLVPEPVSSAVTVTSEIDNAETLGNVSHEVNVIGRLTLAERTPTALSEVVEREAGVTQQRTSNFMGGITVRGLTGKNIAVYRDGVRYTTSVQRGGVSTFLNLNEPSHLETVEILRGPSSAQYGSDSLGGTVHFLSRSPVFASSGSAVRGEVNGSWMTAARAGAANVLVSWANTRLSVLSNVALRNSGDLLTGRGIDSHAAVTRYLGLRSDVLGRRLPGTGFTQYGGVVRALYNLSPWRQITMHYERNQQDRGRRYDQLLGGDGNLIADVRNIMLDFGYVRFSSFHTGMIDHLSITASYNTQREERKNQGGQGDPKAGIDHQYERVHSGGTSFFLAGRLSGHDLLVGGDVYREGVAAPAHTYDPVTGVSALARGRVPHGAQYLLYGTYVQDAWTAWRNRLRISGAVRFGGASYRSRAANSPVVNGRPLFPDDSFHATSMSGRAGAVFTIVPSLRVHGGYSRGFRAPNMTDLGTVGLQGNGMFEASIVDLAGRNALIGDRADDRAVSTGHSVHPLRPEISANYDLGVRFRTSRVSASVAGFLMDLRDSILSQTLLLPPGASGTTLGGYPIIRQLPAGAVFTAVATGPVQVRTNSGVTRALGVEQTLEVRLPRALVWNSNLTWIRTRDFRTGLPPDIEGGTPPVMVNLALRYAPSGRRHHGEIYTTLAGRQGRLSSLALSDRRIGAARARTNIARFFHNGARVRGLVSAGRDQIAGNSDDRLIATAESLVEVQNRVLGEQQSAPMFAEVAGYAVVGVRAGYRLAERSDLFVGVFNLLDKNYRGMGAGIDGPGRGMTVSVRYRF